LDPHGLAVRRGRGDLHPQDGVDDLRQMPLAGVQLIELLTPGEAEQRLGKYTTVGAIRVPSKEDMLRPPADSARAAPPR